LFLPPDAAPHPSLDSPPLTHTPSFVTPGELPGPLIFILPHYMALPPLSWDFHNMHPIIL
jgi:hypothetical protein